MSAQGGLLQWLSVMIAREGPMLWLADQPAGCAVRAAGD